MGYSDNSEAVRRLSLFDIYMQTVGWYSPLMHRAIFKLIWSFVAFLKDLVASRDLFIDLVKRDFKAKYLGSYLSFLWAFVHPAVTIGVMWFVFQVGFKTASVQEVPFILWLMCGMVPWFFFLDSIGAATNSIMEYDYLVKKIVFRVSVLPLIKVASTLIVHVFFVGIIMVAFWYKHIPLDIHLLQIPYYILCLVVIISGISWLTSALSVFIKDIAQFVNIVLQLFFWGTPIFWNVQMLPPHIQSYLKLNPLFYVITGFRDSFIDHVWFWEHPRWTLYYWAVSVGLFVLGGYVFSKLRPHFADVL